MYYTHFSLYVYKYVWCLLPIDCHVAASELWPKPLSLHDPEPPSSKEPDADTIRICKLLVVNVYSATKNSYSVGNQYNWPLTRYPMSHILTITKICHFIY